MKKIKIEGTNKIAIVDDNIYEKYGKYSWHLHLSNGKEYVYTRNSKGIHFYLHRLVLGLKKSDRSFVSFSDGNCLNILKSNLRLGRKSSISKKIPKNNKTGYRGVCYRTLKKEYEDVEGKKSVYENNKYVAQIGYQGKVICIGYFDDAVSAALAYNQKSKELFGESAFQNKIKKGRERQNNT